MRRSRSAGKPRPAGVAMVNADNFSQLRLLRFLSVFDLILPRIRRAVDFV
jgi:hypothetical protein